MSRTQQELRSEKEEAIDRVERHAPPTWNDRAWDVLGSLLRTEGVGSEVTADDVWDALVRAEVESPPERRAIGALMRRAQRAGLIEPTERVKSSSWRRGPARVWHITKLPELSA